MRKVFDDSAGKHVAKPDTAPVDEVFEPIANVFAEECRVCKAKPGQPCTTIVGKQGERVYPHPARVELARRSAQ